MLALRPGELTREFIAGRHQLYIPPFRLYLAVSILFFALQAVLPDYTVEKVDAQGNTVEAPVKITPQEDIRRELEAEGVDTAKIDEVVKGGGCTVEISDNESFDGLEQSFSRACKRMRADGGKAFFERFASTAPKLMFLFLPLMAGVALLFYWKPRRLYAEHLVLFLHNHAFTFLLLGTSSIVSAVSELPVPFLGALDLVNFPLTFTRVVRLPLHACRLRRKAPQDDVEVLRDRHDLLRAARRHHARGLRLHDVQAVVSDPTARSCTSTWTRSTRPSSSATTPSSPASRWSSAAPADAASSPPRATRSAVSACIPPCQCARRSGAARMPLSLRRASSATARSPRKCSRFSASSPTSSRACLSTRPSST